MSITFPTDKQKTPSGLTGLPNKFKRPAFGSLYGFDAQGGGGGAPSSGYDLDGSNNIDTDPVAHFDASLMNGDSNTDWTNADAVGMTDEGSETVWKDRTGNYSAGYQATSGARPAYSASASTAGVPSVLFDGSDGIDFRVADGTGSTVNITLPTGAWHVFVAFEPTALGGSQKMMEGAAHYFGLYVDYFTPWFYSAEGLQTFIVPTNSPSSSGGNDRGATRLTTNWLEARSYDTNDTDGRYQVKSGAVFTATAYNDPGAGELVLNKMGRYSDADNAFAGYLHEIIMFGESLSTGDRATVVTYLQSKYSI